MPVRRHLTNDGVSFSLANQEEPVKATDSCCNGGVEVGRGNAGRVSGGVFALRCINCKRNQHFQLLS